MTEDASLGLIDVVFERFLLIRKVEKTVVKQMKVHRLNGLFTSKSKDSHGGVKRPLFLCL